mmetsp:Transcript_17100/g.39297  ORF Transcript_17100/g.39297 Transcript_17100/m.39297 type:complete len:306 (-) Transcript_17100:472-1389(-)
MVVTYLVRSVGLVHVFHSLPTTSVVFVKSLFRDLLKQFLGEGSEDTPCKVKRFENSTSFVWSLRNELSFESLQETEVKVIFHGKGFFSNNSLHSHDILTHSIRSIKLVRNGTVIVSGHTFSDGGLHQTRQRRKNVDRRENTLGVQLTIQVNLSFRNVSGKIGNRVGNIIVRHGKNRKLCNGTISSNNTSGTFVDGGKIGVHITGVTTTSRNFFTSSRDLTKGISVRRHIGKDGKDVQVTFVCKVFGSSESQTRGNNTFNGRIVGQVEEQRCTLHSTTLFEIGTEETGGFHVNSHSSEDDTEVLFV